MRVLGTLGAAALVIGLAACGSGEPAASTTTTTKAKPAEEGPDLSKAEFKDLTGETDPVVQARDNNYVAEFVIVRSGTTITFENKGRNQHDVAPVEDGAFGTIEADDMEPGSSAELTLTKPGDYAYYCTLHGTKSKGMVGAIRVLGEDEPVPS